jgi:AcrR family transcriptional regulator
MEDNQAAERPARPMLGRGHIVATALAMLDARGVDAFSMRKLGSALGADPMAVYHYFPNKAALFDAVVEAIYIAIDTTGPVPDAWDEAVATYLYAARTVMRAHPGALALIATRPVNTVPVYALLEVIAARLARAGARPTDAIAMVHCLATYAVGQVLADVGAPVGGPEAPPPDPATFDPSVIPTLVAAMEGGWAFDPDAVFDAGLRAMIAGFGSRYGLADET